MTYRKSPGKVAARLAWDRFVDRNAPVIAATGLPASIFSSIGQFDAFLSNGDPRVVALTVSQYDALVTLTESYFAAGYEWFTPAALRVEDRDNLAKRFAG
jgi:hypothetical protein